MDVRFLLAIITMSVMTSYCSALLTACGDDATCAANQANSECDLVTDTDGMGDGECVCAAAFKDDGSGGCTAKVLGDTCAADSDCGGVTNANCNTNECVCEGQYKADGAATCVSKALGDSCTDDSHCGGVTNANCNTNCVCEGQYKEDGANCVSKGSVFYYQHFSALS
ncbi:stabilin-2-like [Ruditapes philippinarum]|uniref:stabilin-2-like n=1 Tax=Ruditapes philippinarum TaxID=129788 RepID=UPI00295BC17E|nr:stabilin-2-like [Ruditapes philippinarum]